MKQPMATGGVWRDDAGQEERGKHGKLLRRREEGVCLVHRQRRREERRGEGGKVFNAEVASNDAIRCEQASGVKFARDCFETMDSSRFFTEEH